MLTGCITILNCMQLLTCMQVTVAINAAKLQLCVHKQNSRSRLCTQKTKAAFTLKWFYALIGIKVGLLQNIFAAIRPRYFYFIMFSVFTCEKFVFLSVIAFPVHHQQISVNKPPKRKVLAMFFTKISIVNTYLVCNEHVHSVPNDTKSAQPRLLKLLT